ncbi:MAG TPA: SiaB family protein kinase [Brumimicrobium sp.]|nr:SiaB family protein kinase [Brumimicrobium sp.]
MSLKSIYELYQTMERENTMLSFKGVVTADLLSSVLQIMESKLDHLEKSTKTRKKVYNVLVECLQNLYHHNENSNGDSSDDIDSIFSKSALLIISKKDGFYEVKTGNYMDRNKAKDLERKIIEINKLNKEELREMYKSVLNHGKLSNKGTAGLGLIDIARKSGNKLEYKFLPIDDDFSFFCLNVKIN